MTDLQMFSALVGFFLPLAISVVQQPKWPEWFRVLSAVVLCSFTGFGIAYLQGDLDGRSLVSSILIVLTVSLTTYRNVWKASGIAGRVENATAVGNKNDSTDSQ